VTNIRAAAYLRLSRSSEDSTSIERQRDSAIKLAQARGWELRPEHIFTDQGRSGWDPHARREGWEDLFNAVRHGEVDVVIAWKLDRLTRRGIGALLDIIGELRDHGVDLVLTSEPVDLTHPASDLLLAVLGWLAQMEAQRTSERSRETAQHLRAGGAAWGSAPFGWKSAPRKDGGPGRRFVLDPETAPSLRHAVAEVTAGASIATTAPSLGLSRHGLAGLLRSPILRGYAWEGHGKTRRMTLDANGRPLQVHEPLLSAEEWSRLQAALDRRRRAPGARRTPPLLSGIIRCGRCGAPLCGQGLNYGCSHAAHRVKGARCQDVADTYVEARALSALMRKRVVEQLAATIADDDAERAHRADAADERVAAILAQLERLEADRLAGVYDAPALSARWREQHQRLAAALADAEAERREARLAQPGGGDLLPLALDIADHWDELERDERRQLIALVIDRVEVAPTARGGTPEQRWARSYARFNVVWTALAEAAIAAQDVDVLEAAGRDQAQREAGVETST
jgi:site-specific DNA recombinase